MNILDIHAYASIFMLPRSYQYLRKTEETMLILLLYDLSTLISTLYIYLYIYILYIYRILYHSEWLTISITDLPSHKISTAIYHTAVDIWCNVAYLLTRFSFCTLTHWKWSDEWHTLALSSWSLNWEARSIKIAQTWRTSKSRRLQVWLINRFIMLAGVIF